MRAVLLFASAVAGALGQPRARHAHGGGFLARGAGGMTEAFATDRHAGAFLAHIHLDTWRDFYAFSETNTHKNLQNILEFSEKSIDNYNLIGYNNTRKAEDNLLRKEVRKVEEMTSRQTVQLIEWLRAQGFTEAQIVECIEYINK